MNVIRTLLLTGGTIHDWRDCGDEIEKILSAPDFHVTRVNDDLSVLESGLDKFDLMILYWTRGDLTDPQRDGLLGRLADGGGFVGVHSATASFLECPKFHEMLGGLFVTHPPVGEYRVSIEQPEHLIVRGMAEFVVRDEQYITEYDPGVNVLASALWQDEKSPVAWTKSWGAGRVFYLALGHDPLACRNENFNRLLIDGSSWAAGRLNPDA